MISTAFRPLQLSIHSDILARFPETMVACSLIEVVVKSNKQVKGSEEKFLGNYKQEVVRLLLDRKVTSENFRQTAVCQSWQKVYDTFNMPEKRSTIEALLDRATKEQAKIEGGKRADLGKISNFVDLYNCVSLEEMTPMGALDMAKIEGDICLRMGIAGETFLGLGRAATPEDVKPEHVVYADSAKVLTWLWNYRDAAAACVPSSSEANKPTYILLFADQAHASNPQAPVSERPGNAQKAIDKANEKVKFIQGNVLGSWLLSKENPHVTINVTKQ